MKTIRSPFQFLDPFTFADRDKFFGRDEAIKQLYDLVFRTPLLLVYGLSGTGKTSLIQCGLASKFDGTDWLPLFIRRQTNINDALAGAINKVMPANTPIQTDRSTSDAIKILYKHYLRPIFLIFDQFEEIFVLGKPDERAQFIHQLKTLLEAELPCSILIIIREEYLGQLYPFEKEIPSLFDFRMRVEPMDNAHVKTVLNESFKKFNITVEQPADNCFEEIIKNVGQGKSGIELPYLQVYLDMLYRENFERTYPNQENTTGTVLPLNLTLEGIQKFGSIENVLDRFLSEQRDRIQQDLKKTDTAIEDNAVQQILDCFVSDEGTKRPVHCTHEQGVFQLSDTEKAHFPNISAASLSTCFTSLEQARLIRTTDETVELAHDSLANLIYQRRSAAQRRINDLRRRLHYAYDDFLDTNEWLNIKQISAFEDILPELNATTEQQKFIANSRLYYESENRKQIEEAERQTAIEKQRANAANALKEEAEKERNRADITAKVAEAQRKKAQDVLDKIYFYDGKFGLAYDKNTRGYGFIDKDLKIKIKFEYNEALPFDYTGYAKVKRVDIYYLIDTTGKIEYKLATYINQLDSSSIALDLRGKNLDIIPNEIFNYQQIKILFLSNNQLTLLPTEIGKLDNLISLNLDFNRLTSLPPEIGNLSNLTSLDLTSNKLTCLPPEIGNLSNLTSFKLGRNQITTLPSEIGKLSNLTSLHLGRNQLTMLSAEIGKLGNLISLHLQQNQLPSLPPEIGNLSNLTSLVLQQNQLTILPLEIGKLVNLTSLNLGSNKLTSLPHEIGKLVNLTSLVLQNNQLTTLSPEIGKLSNLTNLYLDGNQLTTLSPEIGKLSNLTWLNLSYTRLTTLPQEILKLTKLINLNLSYNQITTLPPEIVELSNLTSLDLTGNQLTTLPPEIVELSNLTSLYLDGNQLITLPPDIGKLSNLITLNLLSNKLTSLPANIGNLSNLTILYLFANQIPESEQEKIKELLPNCEIVF